MDFGRSYRLGRGPHFVIEGDEYDCAFFDKRPKFVHYLPNVAIIGNVEFDHADIYPDLAAVQLAFVRLMNVVPRKGLLIAGTESPALVEILPKARCRVETFGLHEGADWRASDVRTGPEGSRFRLVRQGRDEGEFALPMGGEHNVRNALAALAAAAEAGVEPGAAREALAAFRGVKRRLEVRGEAGGVTVYDDFAHHPTAVAATLAALRALGGRGASWPSSSRAPTRPRRARSRTASPGRSPGPTASSSRRRTCRGRCRRASGCRRPGSSRASAGRAATPSSSRPWTRSSGRSWPSCARATGSPSSRTGASAASTTSCSEPSKPPLSR